MLKLGEIEEMTVKGVLSAYDVGESVKETATSLRRKFEHIDLTTVTDNAIYKKVKSLHTNTKTLLKHKQRNAGKNSYIARVGCVI